jgi:hypothetical protein
MPLFPVETDLSGLEYRKSRFRIVKQPIQNWLRLYPSGGLKEFYTPSLPNLNGRIVVSQWHITSAGNGGTDRL